MSAAPETTFPVVSMSQVLRDPEGWSKTDFEVEGEITVRPEATWDGDAYVWEQDNHLLSPDCAVCFSSVPCRQLVKVYLYSKHILVVHEYEGDPEQAS